MPSLKALKGLLGFIAVYQFVVGALLMLTPNLSQLVVGLYGSSVEVTPQFAFILKPLGAYMIMTGIIAAATARAAVPHPSIVLSLSALFGLNVLYRLFTFRYVSATFDIPTWHLVGQIVILSALCLSLAFLARGSLRAVEATVPARP